MLAQTHRNFGITLGLTSICAIDAISDVKISPLLSIAYLYFADKGSLMPDIDHPGSTVGRRNRILAKIIVKLFGHRKFTHSIFFVGLFSFFYWIYNLIRVVGVKILFLVLVDYMRQHSFLSVFSDTLRKSDTIVLINDKPLMASIFLTCGFAVGMLSHIIGDSMTTRGVQLLNPITKKTFKLPFTFKTGSRKEKKVFGLLVLINILLLGVLIYDFYLPNQYKLLLGSFINRVISSWF